MAKITTDIKNNLIKTIIISVIIGLLGFYGGIQYQKGRKGNSNIGSYGGVKQGEMPSGGIQQGGGKQRGNDTNAPISGEITTIDNESMTVKMQDNSSKIIILSDSAKVTKISEGSKNDLIVGVKVTVIGTTSSDGTVSAKNISIGNVIPVGGDQTIGQNPPEVSN